jgi:arylsulfatase A-like enzyme
MTNKFAQPRTQLRALAGARLALLASLLVLAFSLFLALERSAEASPQAGSSSAAAKSAAKPRPNFVVIQTDDQTLEQLYASWTPAGGAPVEAMPNTLNLIAKHGVTFNRYYVSYPLCCPSRVSLLTGRYAHNHNDRGNVPPNGGYSGFASRSAFSHNIATWLQGAGYRTIHIGKFLNGYGDEPFDNGKTVPSGWSAWHTVLHADSDHFYYGYTLNDNGSIDGPFGDSGSLETREYGPRDYFGCPQEELPGQPCVYETDVFNRIAMEELAGTPNTKPFYLQLDYTAPHGDFRKPAGPEPATRDYDSFLGAPLPHGRAQGLDEANVKDKPRFIREAPHLTSTDIHTFRLYYEKGLESLGAIDDGVKDIVDTLRAEGRLQNTYILFTSDNGFFYGEHRLTGGKFLAYEPSTHLPLLIRGPGIKAGTETGELAANIDIAPTVLNLAGVKADASIDGRSLVPFIHNPERRSRRPILFESFVETNDVEENGGGPPAAPPAVAAGRAGGGKSVNRQPEATPSIIAPAKNYYGIRLGPYKYIEWPDGEKELYDIEKDPYELNNRVLNPSFFPVRAFLHRELLRLETCAGRVCREAAGKIPLTRTERRKIQRERQRKKREREKKHRRG